MHLSKWIPLVVAGYTACLSHPVLAEPISAFVPGKPWEIRADLPDFEPDDVLQPKTILGGRTTADVIVTIIVEKEKSSLNPDEVREKYCLYSRPGSKAEWAKEYADANIVIVSTRSTAHFMGKNGCTFNGYASKEDRSFDIHVSADLSKTTREQVVAMIRSFEITPSDEIGAMADLSRALQSAAKPDDRERLLLEFTARFPRNAWAWAVLAEEYAHSHPDLAEKTYLEALAKHRLQPIKNPLNLWFCYDGLGMIYGLTKRYEPASHYFQKGYECAKRMDDKERLAESAYNLACLQAETGNLKSALKYLSEAVRLNPDKRAAARRDSSFESIKTRADFIRLVAD